jgi:hypothetical protein
MNGKKIVLLLGKYFWTLAILLHVLGLIQAWHTGSIYLVDSADYLSQAYNIKHHASIYAAEWNGPLKVDFFSFRPPLYALFIILCESITGTLYGVLFFQMLLSLFNLYMVVRICKEVYAAPQIIKGLLALVLVVYPSQIIHCNLIMSDILFQSILLLALYFTWKWTQFIQWKYSLLAALMFALAMLTKPVSFMLGLGVAAAMGYYLYKQKKIIQLLPFLLLPLVYHGLSAYHKTITGSYHYSSVGPYFALKYMAKYTNSQLYGEVYADHFQDSVMAMADTCTLLQNRHKLMNGAAMTVIQSHPIVFLQFNLRGWLTLLIDPGRFDWVHFLNIDEGNFLGLYHTIYTKGLIVGLTHFIVEAPIMLILILGASLFFNCCIALLFLKWLLSCTNTKSLQVLLAVFVCYILLTTGVLGLARYRIGIAPMLWVACVLYVTPRFTRQ